MHAFNLLRKNNGITAEFALDRKAQISLELYDGRGRSRGIIYNGTAEAGFHKVSLAAPPAAGFYLLQGTVDGRAVTRRITVR